jgi:uncharacterized membrane protein
MIKLEAFMISSPLRLLSVLSFGLFLVSCAQPRAGEESQTALTGNNAISDAALEEANKKVDFVTHVKPILETKCVMCHNTRTMPGRLSLENRRQAMKPGAMGAFIVPGEPEKSPLIQNIETTHAEVNAMPPVGERVTKQEMVVLTKWIKDGAEWPKGSAGKLNPDWEPNP